MQAKRAASTQEGLKSGGGAQRDQAHLHHVRVGQTRQHPAHPLRGGAEKNGGSSCPPPGALPPADQQGVEPLPHPGDRQRAGRTGGHQAPAGGGLPAPFPEEDDQHPPQQWGGAFSERIYRSEPHFFAYTHVGKIFQFGSHWYSLYKNT